MTIPDALVVGAGAAGLAAAVELERRGARVSVLEASARTGGMLWSERVDGLLLERGPSSLGQPSRPVIELLERAGVWARRIAVQQGARTRFLVHRKTPVPLPRTPGEFLRSPLISPAGKIRMAGEAFIPAANSDADESLADFVRRRFGDEALRQLADPFQAGMYAGDPEQLSLAHAFPRFRALERQHGSLMRAMLKGAHAPPAIWSFPGGMREVADALAGSLASPVVLGARVRRVQRESETWRVECANGREFCAPAIVLALPAHQLGALVVDDSLAPAREDLVSMPSAPIVTVSLAWPRSVVRHPLDGLGVLAPSGEGLAILGALFSSSMFAGRAPEETVLCTAFVGGVRRPALPALSDAELLDEAEQELRTLLGIRGPATHRSLARWMRGIPQPGLDHGRRLAAARQLEDGMPGLAFAGSWRTGVGVPGALAGGIEAAAQLAMVQA